LKAHAKIVRCGGCIVIKNGKHTHISNIKLAKEVATLINNECKPNKAFCEHLRRLGIETTTDYIESRILRLVSESRYNKWKYSKPKKKQYVNRGGKAV